MRTSIFQESRRLMIKNLKIRKCQRCKLTIFTKCKNRKVSSSTRQPEIQAVPFPGAMNVGDLGETTEGGRGIIYL